MGTQRSTKVLIDGASVKGGLLSHGLKPNFHRIHRSTSTSTTASPEDALASFLRSQVACV